MEQVTEVVIDTTVEAGKEVSGSFFKQLAEKATEVVVANPVGSAVVGTLATVALLYGGYRTVKHFTEKKDVVAAPATPAPVAVVK